MKPPKILSRSRPNASRSKVADDGLQPRTAATEPAQRGESGVWRSGQTAEQKPRGASYGDKPRSGDKPSFSDKPRYGDKPSFGDKPRYGDKPSFGDKPRYGDKPSFGDKPRYGDKPSFGDKPRYGDKPSFGDKPRYGDKPSFGDKPSYAARKPYGAGVGAGAGSSYGDRPRRNFEAPASHDPGSFERKPRRDFDSAGGDSRPPRRNYEDAAARPSTDAGASPYADRPRRDFSQSNEAGSSYPRKPRPEFTPRASGDAAASPYGEPRRRFDTFRADAPVNGGEETFERRPRAPYGAAAAAERPRRSYGDAPASTPESSGAYTRKPRRDDEVAADTSADRKPRRDGVPQAESFNRPKRVKPALSAPAPVDDDIDDDIDDGDNDNTPFVDRPAYLAARKAESGPLSGERHPALDARGREIRIYGRHAVLGVFKTRPDAIRKLYYARSAQNGLGELLSHLAQAKVSYREVTPEELIKIASSEHHEGVVAEILKPVAPSLSELLASLTKQPKASLLLLDGVANPHNFGALLRIAGHFGVDAVLLTPKSGDAGESAELPLSGAMYRVAEGGAEATPMLRLESFAEFDLIKAAGFEALAAHPHESASLWKHPMPAKVMLMLGAEGAGLSPGLLAHAARRVSIPGSGKVESLNVAQAAAVVLAEIYRQRG